MPSRRKTATPKPPDATVTCPHCRYERPAADTQCHLCGYPWQFHIERKSPPARKRPAR